MKATQPKRESPEQKPGDAGQEREPFVEPRLTFIEPKLVKRGKVEEVTGSFDSFYP